MIMHITVTGTAPAHATPRAGVSCVSATGSFSAFLPTAG